MSHPRRPAPWICLAALLLAPLLPSRSEANPRAELLYSRGIVALHEARLDDALAAFDAAVAADPDDGLTWYYRGLAQRRLARLPEAIADFSRAAALLPSEPNVAFELGLALSESEDYTGALPHLRLAASQGPRQARAALVLGLAELRLQHLDAADTAFRQAARDPELAPRAHFYRGVTAFRRGDWQEATTQFETVTTLAPDAALAGEARAYLEELRRGAPLRDYQLFAEAGLQYDSNVCLTTDDGCEYIQEGRTVDEADGRAIFAAGGRYSLWRNDDLAVSTGYDFFQSLHFDLHEFDLQNHRPDLQVAYRRGAVRVGIIARYDFFLRDNDSFLHEITAVPWLVVDNGAFGNTELHYRLRDREFVDDTFDDRSGLNHVLAARQLVPVPQAPGSHVGVGLRYDHEEPSSNRAAAQRFAYDGIEGGIEGRWLAPAEVVVGVGYAVRYENYDNVSADFDRSFDAREDVEQLVRIEAEKPVTSWLGLRLGYYGTFNDSNQSEQFDYDRHVVSASLAARY